MNPLAMWLSGGLVERFGWTLLHSVWEGALVAALLAVLLAALGGRSAGARYLAACGALLLMAAAPALTFLLLPPSSQPAAVVIVVDPAADDVARPVSEPASGSAAPAAPVDRQRVNGVELLGPDAALGLAPALPWHEQLAQRLQPLLPWCVTTWFCGVALLSLWRLGGLLALRRCRRAAVAVQGDWQTAAIRLADRLGLRRSVALLASAAIHTPCVLGWLKPVILLPVGTLSGLHPAELDAIIAHELAHIRRWDYVVNLVQTALETLLFYQPAVWWISARVRAERENCCDDLAVAVCGNRRAYAGALASLAGLRRAAWVAPAATGWKLLPRIRRIVGGSDDAPRPASWLPPLVVLTSLSVVAVVLLFGGSSLVDVKAEAAKEADGNAPPASSEPNAGRAANGTAKPPAVRERATRALLANNAAELLALFKAAEYPWQQAEVCEKMIALGDKSIAPDMLAALKSEERGERCNAGWVLAGLGDPRGLDAVIAELKDTGDRPTKRTRSDGKPDVPGQITQDRYYAASILGRIADRRAVPALIEALKDKAIGYKAAIVLADMGDPRAAAALKEMLKSADSDERLWAGYGLAGIGDPAGVPAIAEFLKAPQWTNRRHAADALGKFRDKHAVAALIEALKDEQTEVRVSAAWALGEIGDAAAIAALQALSADKTLTTSGPTTTPAEAAAKAIDEIKSPRTRAYTLRVTFDDDAKPKLLFRGLDLSSAPVTKKLSEIPDLWDAASGQLRKDVQYTRSILDLNGKILTRGHCAAVYYRPDKNVYYVSLDEGPLGSSAITEKYYGPFSGDPHKTLDLKPPLPEAAAGAARPKLAFRDLDLTDAPMTTDLSKLPDVWDYPAGATAPRGVRANVSFSPHLLEQGYAEWIVYAADKDVFYVNFDSVWSMTEHYYGPFKGNPFTRFGLKAILSAATVRAGARGLPDKENDRAAAEKERARAAELQKARAARDLNLMSQHWRQGSAEMLKRLKPGEIVKMQVFQIDNDNQREYAAAPFGLDEQSNGPAVAAFLAQLDRAKPPSPQHPASEGRPWPPNRVLVVQPVDGEPFEIEYSADFRAFFAGLASRELKGMLYVLGGGLTRISVIHMDGERVQEVLHLDAGNVETTTRRGTSDAGIRLSNQDGLRLYLRLRSGDGTTLMEDERPMRYGAASVYASKGPGKYVVLVENPENP